MSPITEFVFDLITKRPKDVSHATDKLWVFAEDPNAPGEAELTFTESNIKTTLLILMGGDKHARNLIDQVEIAVIKKHLDNCILITDDATMYEGSLYVEH